VVSVVRVKVMASKKVRCVALVVAGAYSVSGFVTVPPLAPGPAARSLSLRAKPLVVGLAGRRSVSVARQAAPQPAAENFFAPSVRTPLRTLGIASLWACLVAYVALGAPGKDEASQALDSELLKVLVSNPFDPAAPPFFCVVFNFMGIWPAWYASTLLPGGKDQSPLPAGPFVGASVAFGFFALAPYLALRRYQPDPVSSESLGGVTRWFEGKASALLLLGGALGLTGYALSQPDLSACADQYASLFSSQLFVHVTSLDFLCLWVMSYGVMVEDMRRRGMDESSAPLFWAVPVLGHCAYLAVRPGLPSADAEA